MQVGAISHSISDLVTHRKPRRGGSAALFFVSLGQAVVQQRESGSVCAMVLSVDVAKVGSYWERGQHKKTVIKNILSVLLGNEHTTSGGEHDDFLQGQ